MKAESLDSAFKTCRALWRNTKIRQTEQGNATYRGILPICQTCCIFNGFHDCPVCYLENCNSLSAVSGSVSGTGKSNADIF